MRTGAVIDLVSDDSEPDEPADLIPLKDLFSAAKPKNASAPPRPTSSPRPTSTARKASPRKASPRKASPRNASPRNASPRNASPRNASPKNASPRNASPKKASLPQKAREKEEKAPKGRDEIAPKAREERAPKAREERAPKAREERAPKARGEMALEEGELSEDDDESEDGEQEREEGEEEEGEEEEEDGDEGGEGATKCGVCEPCDVLSRLSASASAQEAAALRTLPASLKACSHPKVPTERDLAAANADFAGSCLSGRLVGHDHQIRVVNQMLKDEISVFTAAHPMGSGKTLTAVLVAECLLHQAWNQKKQLKRVIFVAPASLLTNMYQQLLRFGKTEEHIARYYCFWSFEKAMNDHQRFADAVRNNILIVDEIHEIRSRILTRKELYTDAEKKLLDKERSGQALDKVEQRRVKKLVNRQMWLGKPVTSGKKSAAIILAARHAWKVLLLTGTLLVNDLGDLYNVKMIYQRLPGLNYREDGKYSFTHKKMARPKKEWETLQMLEPILGCRMSYIQPEEIKADIPTSHTTTVLIEMPADYYRNYIQVEKSLLKKSGIGGKKISGNVELFNEPGKFWNRLRQVSNKSLGIDSVKIDFILNLLKNGGAPMIISTSFVKRGIAPLMAALRQHGYSFCTISGDVSKMADRSLAQSAYNKGLVDVMLLTKAGSTGFDFHGTRTHINLEPAWHIAGRLQATFRGIRVGSHRNVSYKHVQVYNLYLAKPEDLEKYREKIKGQIEGYNPGAAQELLVIRPASEKQRSPTRLNDDFSDLDSDDKHLPGIDLVIYDLQMKKAAVTQRLYRNYIQRRWRIESPACSKPPVSPKAAPPASPRAPSPKAAAPPASPKAPRAPSPRAPSPNLPRALSPKAPRALPIAPGAPAAKSPASAAKSPPPAAKSPLPAAKSPPSAAKSPASAAVAARLDPAAVARLWPPMPPRRPGTVRGRLAHILARKG